MGGRCLEQEAARQHLDRSLQCDLVTKKLLGDSRVGCTEVIPQQEQVRNRGGAKQLFFASLECRTMWTKGLRWQQERFKSDSRRNLVTMKHREILSEMLEKCLGRCLKQWDMGSHSRGRSMDKMTSRHLTQPTNESDSAENSELTCS